jgi:hypothetical protein
MYIRSSTRKNNSARSSQRGIRWPAGRVVCGADALSDPGAGAGLAGSEGDLDSGCWDMF